MLQRHSVLLASVLTRMSKATFPISCFNLDVRDTMHIAGRTAAGRVPSQLHRPKLRAGCILQAQSVIVYFREDQVATIAAPGDDLVAVSVWLHAAVAAVGTRQPPTGRLLCLITCVAWHQYGVHKGLWNHHKVATAWRIHAMLLCPTTQVVSGCAGSQQLWGDHSHRVLARELWHL